MRYREKEKNGRRQKKGQQEEQTKTETEKDISGSDQENFCFISLHRWDWLTEVIKI